MPDFSYEQDCLTPVAGVDEAGRGPYAGPVVAAAVILDQATLPLSLRESLKDSKKISADKRVTLYRMITECTAFSIGVADVAEIDRLNILKATHLAMERAVTGLSVAPREVLVDGNNAPQLGCKVRCVIGGDNLSFSIAAASILAKVYRDRLMHELAEKFPYYGWEKNAGYGTRSHIAALEEYGVTPHHRRSFRPIRELLEKQGDIAVAAKKIA